MRPIRILSLLLAGLMLAIASRAQNTTGSITGRITDPSGAAALGAQIEVLNLGTSEKRTLTTGDTGDYTATLLLPGRYSISTTAAGFKTGVKTGIALDVDQVSHLLLAAGFEAECPRPGHEHSASNFAPVRASSPKNGTLARNHPSSPFQASPFHSKYSEKP